MPVLARPDFFFLFRVVAAEIAEVMFALCFLPTLFLCDHVSLSTVILKGSLCHILWLFLLRERCSRREEEKKYIYIYAYIYV